MHSAPPGTTGRGAFASGPGSGASLAEELAREKALWRRLEEHGEGIASLREGHGRHEARLNAMEQRVDRAVHTLTLQHGELKSSVDTGFKSSSQDLRELRDAMIARSSVDAYRNRLIALGIAVVSVVVAALGLMVTL